MNKNERGKFMKINIKDWVQTKKEEIQKTTQNFTIPPRLLIMQIGDNPASNSYIKGKMKDAAECGIHADLYKTAEPWTAIQFLRESVNRYDGIILQEPSGFTKENYNSFYRIISPTQDVDGFMKNSKHKQCTPQGIMDIIDTFYPDQYLRDNIAVVIGRGELVGKPLAAMLIEKGLTVISCNSQTPNIAEFTKKADIVISAVGKEKLVTRDMLKDGAFVIDAGITFDENGKLCGDCDKAMYNDDTIAITTVPGGVGLTTRLSLMQNTMAAFYARNSHV